METLGTRAAACAAVQPLSAGLPVCDLDQPGCSADEGSLLSPAVCPACVGKTFSEMNSLHSVRRSCKVVHISSLMISRSSVCLTIFPLSQINLIEAFLESDGFFCLLFERLAF